MATSASSTGTRDRMENKCEYLQEAMKILETIPVEEEGGYEIVK